MKANNKCFYTIFKTAVGFFGVCAADKGIFRSCLPVKTKQLCQKLLTKGLDNIKYKNSLCPHLQKSIMAYYKGSYVEFNEEVDLSEFTPFARKVLESCRKVKYGKIMTYKELAKLSGRPNAARAVGAVMARNPIPLIIPCHRILSADGSLRGFSAPGGLKTKQKMLDLEKNSNLERKRQDKHN